MQIDFNINNYVMVRLTDIGREELKRQAEELRQRVPAIKHPYSLPKEDAKGFSKWQMHHLMSRLGHLCILGCEPPFEVDIKIQINTKCEK